MKYASIAKLCCCSICSKHVSIMKPTVSRRRHLEALAAVVELPVERDVSRVCVHSATYAQLFVEARANQQRGWLGAYWRVCEEGDFGNYSFWIEIVWANVK